MGNLAKVPIIGGSLGEVASKLAKLIQELCPSALLPPAFPSQIPVYTSPTQKLSPFCLGMSITTVDPPNGHSCPLFPNLLPPAEQSPWKQHCSSKWERDRGPEPPEPGHVDISILRKWGEDSCT